MNAVAVPIAAGDASSCAPTGRSASRKRLEARLRGLAGKAIADYRMIGDGDLCGSQDGLERRRIKAMLAEWERESPGRTAQIFRAIRHVGPSHLADRKLFDFETL